MFNVAIFLPRRRLDAALVEPDSIEGASIELKPLASGPARAVHEAPHAMTFLSQHVSLAPRVRFKPAIGVPGAISVIRKRGGLTVAALLLSGTLLISGCSEAEQDRKRVV